MSAYLQLGHDSENLIGVAGLEGFSGLILSPVNRSEVELSKLIPGFRKKAEYDIVLDPQLYCPRTERGQLPKHRYFPRDIDAANVPSPQWWRNLIRQLIAEAQALEVNVVCSPVILPGKYDPEYYTASIEVFSMLSEELGKTAMRPAQTVCVALKDLASADDALRIASIISSHRPPLCYIVFEANTPPRDEIGEGWTRCPKCGHWHEVDDPPRPRVVDSTRLSSLMLLISVLEKAGCPTLISHCSSDMVLMKAAGASHCASGKFFNLRRFSRSRFDEPEGAGGGQLPYWFEQGLLAFLRVADIARLRRSGFDNFLGVGASSNTFASQILLQFANEPTKAWLGLSWRQYLAWFELAERQLSGAEAPSVVSSWLKEAEQRWEQLDAKDVLLEERRNDGRWIRPWRQALGDFRQFGL